MPPRIPPLVKKDFKPCLLLSKTSARQGCFQLKVEGTVYSRAGDILLAAELIPIKGYMMPLLPKIALIVVAGVYVAIAIVSNQAEGGSLDYAEMKQISFSAHN